MLMKVGDEWQLMLLDYLNGSYIAFAWDAFEDDGGKVSRSTRRSIVR